MFDLPFWGAVCRQHAAGRMGAGRVRSTGGGRMHVCEQRGALAREGAVRWAVSCELAAVSG